MPEPMQNDENGEVVYGSDTDVYPNSISGHKTQPANNPDDNVRLMITKLVLENFKSYAGVQEVVPFHKCFSSVVGPNGSGKSNVIDSLLFVFGRRAKDIRSGKVGHLIHNSTDHQNVDSCKVSVYFVDIKDDCDDPDAYEVVRGLNW